MKKIIAIVVALFLGLMLLGSVPANASPAKGDGIAKVVAKKGPPRCKSGSRTGVKHINDGSLGADEWWLRTKVLYNYCRQGDHDWVVPLTATYSYDFEGDSMSCSIVNPSALMWMKYDLSFTGGDGRHVQVMQVAIKCSKNSHASFTQQLGGQYGRLVFKHSPGQVIRPRFDVNVQSDTSLHQNQIHGSYGSQMPKVAL